MALLSILVSCAFMLAQTVALPQLPNQSDIGIIGGADGPTAVFISELPSDVSDESIYFSDDEFIENNDDTEDYISVFVEADNLSLDNIVPTQTILFKGETCADIFVDLLEKNGYTPIYSGATDEGFYLSAIEGIDTSKILIPEYVKEFLAEKGVEYDENNLIEGVLGEFDITDTSGWIFSVNGEMPSVGMSDYIPSDGDELKLSFSLYYGEDIGL